MFYVQWQIFHAYENKVNNNIKTTEKRKRGKTTGSATFDCHWTNMGSWIMDRDKKKTFCSGFSKDIRRV
jgi:hypothetical protein